LGFERYGKPVAALVPVDAVRILAGEEVSRATRAAIAEAAALFVANMPGAEPPPAKPAAKRKVSVKRKRKTLGKSV